MKLRTLITAVAIAVGSSSLAHEAVTIGPNGGRVIYLDSTAIPNVEVFVNAEGHAEISLLDKDRKPIALRDHSITVTAGPRAEAKKMTTEKKGTKFVSAKVPDGAPYTIILQLKDAPADKSLLARLNYDPTPAAAGKPAYLDDSVNAASGENIAVPDTAAGIWAELNQHQNELVEDVAERKYEALDEVTRAYPKLAKALPAKSGDNEAQAGVLVGTLVKHLAGVRDASAARKLDEAKPHLDGVTQTLGELKKLYPEPVANAKLPE